MKISMELRSESLESLGETYDVEVNDETVEISIVDTEGFIEYFELPLDVFLKISKAINN